MSDTPREQLTPSIDCLAGVTGRGPMQTHVCGLPEGHNEVHRCYWCGLTWAEGHLKVRTTCSRPRVIGIYAAGGDFYRQQRERLVGSD